MPENPAETIPENPESPALRCGELVLLHEENRERRIMCAIAHCGLNLYHDDGELQDSREYPWIDWKRDPVNEIENKLHERFARRMRAETEKRSQQNT